MAFACFTIDQSRSAFEEVNSSELFIGLVRANAPGVLNSGVGGKSPDAGSISESVNLPLGPKAEAGRIPSDASQSSLGSA
jgi:hypothetical protein